jgi:hypothetical protein
MFYLKWRRHGRGRIPPFVFVIPTLAYFGLQGILWADWRVVPVLSGSGNIVMPLTGIIAAIHSLTSALWPLEALWLIEASVMAGFLAFTLLALRWSRAVAHVRFAFLLYIGLTNSLSMESWHEGWSFLRLLSEVYVLGVFIVLDTAKTPRPILFTPIILLWAFLIAIML